MTGNGFKSFQHMPAAPHGPYATSLATSILLEMVTVIMLYQHAFTIRCMVASVYYLQQQQHKQKSQCSNSRSQTTRKILPIANSIVQYGEFTKVGGAAQHEWNRANTLHFQSIEDSGSMVSHSLYMSLFISLQCSSVSWSLQSPQSLIIFLQTIRHGDMQRPETRRQSGTLER